MDLACLMISHDNMIKSLSNLMGRSPSGFLIMLPSFVAIVIVVVKI